MSCTIQFGPLHALQNIPAPQSGMGADTKRDGETVELLTGGRVIYRKPTSHKAFKMDWKGGIAGLQPLMDVFEGAYGSGPFYMRDPRYKDDNLLPARWAASYQLAHVANGWANSAEVADTSAATRAAKFTVLATDTTTASTHKITTTRVLVEPGRPLYLGAWGSATGGAMVKWAGILADGSPTVSGSVVPDDYGNTTMLVSGDHTLLAVELSLYVPQGSVLTLNHLDLSHDKCVSQTRSGKGVGAVNFSSDITGDFIGGVTGRIGMSVELTEVENI